MSSMIVIVSKAIFEKAKSFTGKTLTLGDVYNTDRYISANKGLEKNLAKDLYLVTVQGDELWLVGVLRAPAHKKDAWVAATNEVPITSLQPIAVQLRFESDTGINLEKMAMSLQTPRVLTSSDVALLEQAAGSKAPSGTSVTKATKAAAPKADAKTKVVVRLLSHILKRSEDDILNDTDTYAAYMWADEYLSMLGEDVDWSKRLPKKGGGFSRYDDEHSLFRDEPLYAERISDPAFAEFMKNRDGALPMPMARQLMKAGVIEPEYPVIVGHLVRGTLVKVAMTMFLETDELSFDEDGHDVDKLWQKVIGEIEYEDLQQQLGCFFQDVDAARCYGAYFSGTTGGPLDKSCIGKTAAAWEFGEGQASLAIVRLAEDPHPPLPPSALKPNKEQPKATKATKAKAVVAVPDNPASIEKALDASNDIAQKLVLIKGLLAVFDTIPLARQPNSLEVIGDALAGQKKPEALALFRQALALGESRHPNDNGVRINVIFRFAETTDVAGNREEAIAVYTRLMVLMPDFSTLWFNRACEHAIMGNAALAVTDLTDAIKLDASWRAAARKDAYFNPIRKDAAFAALTK